MQGGILCFTQAILDSYAEAMMCRKASLIKSKRLSCYPQAS